MLEFLFRLEYKRRSLRRRVLDNCTDLDRRFFGIAALIFFVALFPMLLAPPAAVAVAPPEAVVVGSLILLGFLLSATIVLLPVGLIFF